MKKNTSPLHVSELREAFVRKFRIASGNRWEQQKQLPHAFEKRDMETDQLLELFRKNWEILSAHLHKHSCPKTIRGSFLIVQVFHSVYLSEFHFQKEKIENKIGILSHGQIKAIKLSHS